MTMLDEKNPINAESVIKSLYQVNITAFMDKWGPEEFIQVYDPETQMQGYLVIDNTILGPGTGGICISPYITPLEVFQSARNTTWKCALAEVPFGGAYSGIRAIPSNRNMTNLIKAFANKIAPLLPSKYIPYPDYPIGQKEISLFVENVGDLQSATGKPEKYGGIPYDLGIIGFGIGVALDTTLGIVNEELNLPDSLSGASIAIQGFNKTSLDTAKFLVNKGAKIISISDDESTVYREEGLDLKYINNSSSQDITKAIMNENFQIFKNKEYILKTSCDILILNDRNFNITNKNFSKIRADFIVEGVNNAITIEAEKNLFMNNKLILPDILSTSGDVIASYAEYQKKSAAEAFSMIESKITENTRSVINESLNSGIITRIIAKEIAQQRIMDASDVD